MRPARIRRSLISSILLFLAIFLTSVLLAYSAAFPPRQSPSNPFAPNVFSTQDDSTHESPQELLIGGDMLESPEKKTLIHNNFGPENERGVRIVNGVPFELTKNKVLPPKDLPGVLDACDATKPSFAEHIEHVFGKTKCDAAQIPWDEFACVAKCMVKEPELEEAFRVHSLAAHDPAYVVRLCITKIFPVLVWIDTSGRIRFLECTEKGMLGPENFQQAMRSLHMTLCMIRFPFERDIIFGFDPSDYAAPNFQSPYSMFQYMIPLPAVVRFVGTPSVPSLLFPTGSHVVASAHCNLRDASIWWTICDAHYVTREAIPFTTRSRPLMWRGRPTGVPWPDAPWYFQQRMRLVEDFADQYGFNVAFVRDIPRYGKSDPDIQKMWVQKGEINKMDHPMHAHLIHVDGNTASWGLAHKLITGSVVVWVLSPFRYREHYYAHLVPWEHYVPVAADMSDLASARDWLLQHPKEAQALAERTVKLFKTRFRAEDLYCYISRLLFVIYESQTRGPEVVSDSFLLKQLGSEKFNRFQDVADVATLEKMRMRH